MIEFSVPNPNYANDLMELIRAFEQRTDERLSLAVDYSVSENVMSVTLRSDKFENFVKIYRFPYAPVDALDAKRIEKRHLKTAIYNTLVFLTGVSLPYGCLTGIRPTKLYAELGDRARDMFLHDFSVRPEKVELIERVIRAQQGIRNPDPERIADLFVFVPFCPTRCAYCSFVSMPVDRQKKLLRPYTDCVVREIAFLKEEAARLGYRFRSVYVGGGTPTALPLSMLEAVLAACRVEDAEEFTVEAGRPDTITPAAVRLLKKAGVSRVSVNPQTFNDATLERIGRRHTAEDVLRAFKLVKKKFKVNMDLIAMLPGESFEDFAASVDTAAGLAPDNITVHTLYLKKGSSLKNEGYAVTANSLAESMVDYAFSRLTEEGYEPYYMYRQKYTGGNLENVGYAKPGTACLYNMDIMEEDTTVFAAGAAAISKKVTPSINLIERNANYKEPLEYIKHFDTVMQRQRDFWAKPVPARDFPDAIDSVCDGE